MSQAILTGSYSDIGSNNIIGSDLETNLPLPTESISVEGDPPVISGNWTSQIEGGSQVYLNQKFGRDQSQHDLNLSKDRVKDIKKLMRSQCIYQSPQYINTAYIHSNEDYLDYFSMLVSPSPVSNVGYDLIDKYKRGVGNKITYWTNEEGRRIPFATSPSPNSNQDILPILTMRESGTGAENWNYVFNSLYYPSPDQVNKHENIIKPNKSQLTCVSIDKENPDNECGSYNPQDGVEDQYKCLNHGYGNKCRLNVDLSSSEVGVLLSDTASSRDLQIEDSESPSSRRLSEYNNFKGVSDGLGDGLYGRWDSVNNLCGSTPMKCSGNLNDDYISYLGGTPFNIASPASDCPTYFSNIINHNKLGDGAVIENSRNSYTEVEKRKLCEKQFVNGMDLTDVQNSPLRNSSNSDTGCTYTSTPGFYTDLNLVDKCSIDDLYEKLQESGMRQVDLEKIEFTNGCNKRKIGYDIEHVCASPDGRYLSQSQTVEKCIGMKEDIMGSNGLTPCSASDNCGSPATDCAVNNEQGTCQWVPVLKAKEYVDEDSQCNLRCKDGAIQNGSQPYCKSAPDYSDKNNNFEAGYLNPYLNPEWELNNFSCTAMDETECSGSGEFKANLEWNPQKNRFETTVQACSQTRPTGGDDVTPPPPATPPSAPQCQNLEQPGVISTLGKATVSLIMFIVAGLFKFGNQPAYALGNLTFGFLLAWNGVASGLFMSAANSRFYKYGNSFDVHFKKLSLGSLITIMTTIFFTFKLGNSAAGPATNMGPFLNELFLGGLSIYVIGIIIYLYFKAGDSQIYGWEGINYINSIAIILASFGFLFCKGGGLSAPAPGAGRIKTIATIIAMIGVVSLIIAGLASSGVISLSHCSDNQGYMNYREGFSLQEGFETKPSECYTYSDCKLNNNCVWDEIISIIDGPQDYTTSFENRNMNLTPADEMLETMYGFIYLVHKYNDTPGSSQNIYFKNSQDLTHSWSNLFKPPTGDSNKPFLQIPFPRGNNPSPFEINYLVDLDRESDIYKWVDSWDNIQDLLSDNSGNKKSMLSLTDQYNVDLPTIKKVFWYFLNVFHDGTNGKLRPEIMINSDGAGTPTIDATTSTYLSAATTVNDFEDNYSPTDPPTNYEIRKAIPLIKLIFKDWLNKNLEIRSKTENGIKKFTACEYSNLADKVCTYGAESNGICKESCDTDEILDYTAAQCINNSGDNIWGTPSTIMNHPEAQGDKTLRSYHPNFQRFNCEFRRDTTDGNAVPSDNKYKKVGCIQNLLLNHNVIPGESCGDYLERAEAGGYNITCNDAVSRSEMGNYGKQTLFDRSKRCYAQFGVGNEKASVETKDKICGGTGDRGGKDKVYEWKSENQIEVLDDSTLSTTTGKYIKKTGGISPVISCCVEKSDSSASPQCNVGSWVPVPDISDGGYCSPSPDSFQSVDSLPNHLTPKEFCNAFPELYNRPGVGCAELDTPSANADPPPSPPIMPQPSPSPPTTEQDPPSPSPS